MKEVDTNGNELQLFTSVRDAANFMGTKHETFRRQIRKNPSNYYKGFVFKYAV